MAITRRQFVGGGFATGAALLAGDFPRLDAAVARHEPPFLEATIPQLQALMHAGRLTSRELTAAYLHRMVELNPLLGAVIETNPHAIAIAVERDRERRHGHLRGPLHGIPILLKDNIATADAMQTTAGSLALVNSRVPADAPIVRRLRDAGAVILGKANLSEWANFRGFAPFNGWSARGGFTRNPYLLDFDPCGSSSGSAVAPAANLCAAAVGTETDGSVVCPAGNNLVVGLKPSMGLLSQDGIIPIGHSQDTAGPIARTVTDAAILLGVMQTPFGRMARLPVPRDYTRFLRRGALKGARIGVDERYFTPDYGGEPDLIAVVQDAMDAMTARGATLVPTDSGDIALYFDAEVTVLLYEFKAQIAEYLAPLRHTRMRTLADLIAFNTRHCRAEMKYFGQQLFELSEDTSGDLTDPAYLQARAFCPRVRRRQRHRRGDRARQPRRDHRAELQFRVDAGGGRRLSEYFRTGGADSRGQARRAFGCTADSCASRSSWPWPTTSSRRSARGARPRCSARCLPSLQMPGSAEARRSRSSLRGRTCGAISAPGSQSTGSERGPQSRQDQGRDCSKPWTAWSASRRGQYAIA